MVFSGAVATSMGSIRDRVAAKGCPVVHLVDGQVSDQTRNVDPSTTVRVDSGLPEELTPMSLAVLAQLPAHRVAVARGFNADRPREIRKVTRTW